MQLLTSNFTPLNLPNQTFISKWESLFQSSEFIKIGVGYASNDSILYLRKLLEFNQPKKLDLCLGMAFFDGLSRSQFDAAQNLNRFLLENELGQLKVARAFPFHGKVQSFTGVKNLKTCLIGSSNLSNIVPVVGVQRRNYEVDLEVTNSEIVGNVDDLLDQLFSDSSVAFDSIISQIKINDNNNTLLASRSDVNQVGESTLEKVLSNLTKNSFEIPLKDAPKSNLNAFFGEGRKGKQGFVKPRHWYEVEIIVDLAIQKSGKNYPTNSDFIVYTDDGYQFIMRTSGDNGKNLRSRDDLTILGRWIKGRMEMNGALHSGELITMENFRKYGRDSISFRQTNLSEKFDDQGIKLDVWYLDFKSPVRNQ